ncbi:MAG: GAF domain-containing protein [Anaerolineae bacterium]|nr:GAF domain-containing protein [Anaerolineae bacterium]
MNKPPLGRLLDRRQIQTLLQDWSTLSDMPVILGVAEASGRWIAAYPAAPQDAPIEQVCQSGQMLIDEKTAILPLIDDDGNVLGALYMAPDRPNLRVALHHVLSLVLQKEAMLKSLAQETLDRYREVNLLYRVHETIGTSVDLNEVVRRVLDESVRIIKADGGMVLLPDELTNALIACDSTGLDDPTRRDALLGHESAQQVFQSGRPQILNELQAAASFPFSALLAAPLKAQEITQGVITLFRTQQDAMFTAGDEKLLNALASQAGIAIANARQVQEREQRFKQQIQALRIEIDEVKKQKEVAHITESEYFRYLQENAQRMREEFDI